jgi:hypothetical protein
MDWPAVLLRAAQPAAVGWLERPQWASGQPKGREPLAERTEAALPEQAPLAWIPAAASTAKLRPEAPAKPDVGAPWDGARQQEGLPDRESREDEGLRRARPGAALPAGTAEAGGAQPEPAERPGGVLRETAVREQPASDPTPAGPKIQRCTRCT